MNASPSITGIVLARNEDCHLASAIENIADFCDRIILCDHCSTDRTPGIFQTMARRYPHAEFHSLRHPRESHGLLKPLAGTPTWVFGVDGDEIYDPAGLAAFRTRLLAGGFGRVWRIKGNVLHCREFDRAARKASGHLAPPSRSVTKLYNFAAISAWEGNTVERLHGGTITFQPGWSDSMKRNLQDELSWDESPLRCLHMCFLRRSSQEKESAPVRENIVELYCGGLRGKLYRLVDRILGRAARSGWKQNHYCRGPLQTVDTGPFFSS